jgi:lipopolysaccharide export system permease protein
VKILDRYIFREMIVPFIFGVVVFTVLFISAGILFQIARMMAEKGASPVQAMKFLGNSIPSILVFITPIAMLLSCLIAFGRLSGDSEIVAIKAGGISFYRVAVPGIIMAFLVSLCVLFISTKVAPHATYAANNIFLEQLTRDTGRVREDLILKFNTPDGAYRLVYARRLNPASGVMEHVNVHDYRDEKPVRYTYASEARYDGKTWSLKDGDLEEYSWKAGSEREIAFRGHFSTCRIFIPFSPAELGRREKTPEEMDRPEIKEKIASLLEGAPRPGKMGTDDPASRIWGRINELAVMYHQKVSIPFTCLVFGLFGIPLGLRPHRTSTSIGMGLSLVFSLIYYILMTIGIVLGKTGVLPPLFASWLPNLVFGGVGGYLMVRSGRQ